MNIATHPQKTTNHSQHEHFCNEEWGKISKARGAYLVNKYPQKTDSCSCCQGCLHQVLTLVGEYLRNEAMSVLSIEFSIFFSDLNKFTAFVCYVVGVFLFCFFGQGKVPFKSRIFTEPDTTECKHFEWIYIHFLSTVEPAFSLTQSKGTRVRHTNTQGLLASSKYHRH